MKPSDTLNSRVTTGIKDLKIFFSTCLSMHMLPVLFAIVLIVVAERKSGQRLADTESKPVAAANVDKAPALKNYVLLNPTDLTQVVAIYRMSRVVMNIIR